jgi:hypothetical protein
MKKVFLFALLLSFGVNLTFAQSDAQKPIVKQASYFDVSPPLRDMVQSNDANIDLSVKETIVKNKLNVYSNESGQTDYQVTDEVVQTTFGNRVVTDTTIQNFDGNSGNGSLVPPDTQGDVGPSHYVQILNSKFSIYNKNGVKILGPLNNSTIFNGLPHNINDGDGIVLYDENADRWLFSQFSVTNSDGTYWENVAISQTNDPTGSWYRYQFEFEDMPDYPKLAVWRDGYYMTIRRFNSSGWVGPAAVAMDRAKMLVGDNSAAMIMFPLPSSSEGPQAADCDSEFPPEGTPCPVSILYSTATGSCRIYDFHADWTTPANSTFNLGVTIPISVFSYYSSGANAIPQKGTSQLLDAMSGRRVMFRMPYRKFSTHSSLLLCTTVKVNNIASIRWMELRNTGSGWTLYQEGTYSPNDGNYRWMPSIAMDAAGNIALGYSISSSNLFPSIRYTGRMNGDPLGQMTIQEKGIINGGGCQSAGWSDGRWGDYSMMSADPVEVGKFWYTQEYYATSSVANWKTRIASFSFGNALSAVVTASPNPVCIGDSTQLTALAYGGSGTYSFSWTSDPPGFNSTVQNPKAAPTVDTKYYVTTNDGTTSRLDSVTVIVTLRPTVSAGNDKTVCWYVTEVELNGSASNYNQIGWVSSGTGTFSNVTSPASIYYPSLNDKIAGSVDLRLVATSQAPCTGNVADTVHVVFDVCASVPGQTSQEPALMIQPNPAHGSVTISIRGVNEPSTLTITSMEGKTMLSENIEGSASTVLKQMDLSGYAKGVYFVQLRSGKKVLTEKMIVQ